MGKSYSVEHAAALAEHLPWGSALRREIDPQQEWPISAHLLAEIEYDIRCALYSGKGPKLRWLQPPKHAGKTSVASAAEMRRVADALGIPEERR